MLYINTNLGKPCYCPGDWRRRRQALPFSPDVPNVSLHSLSKTKSFISQQPNFIKSYFNFTSNLNLYKLAYTRIAPTLFLPTLLHIFIPQINFFPSKLSIFICPPSLVFRPPISFIFTTSRELFKLSQWYNLTSSALWS